MVWEILLTAVAGDDVHYRKMDRIKFNSRIDKVKIPSGYNYGHLF